MNNTNENREVLLKVDHLCQYFKMGNKELKAVDDVSFEIYRGEVFGLVGESGCGKTTLGRTILKLYEPNEGQIIFDGHDITKISKNEMRKYRTSMQLIFQDPYSSLPPRMTVGSIISEAVIYHNIVPN